ncbi:MAG: hypothetical protein ACEPOZ_07210 [Marinifilaceae bacterium]
MTTIVAGVVTVISYNNIGVGNDFFKLFPHKWGIKAIFIHKFQYILLVHCFCSMASCRLSTKFLSGRFINQIPTSVFSSANAFRIVRKI